MANTATTPGPASLGSVPDTTARPVLSVVVPVRNVATYLPDLLASLARNLDIAAEFVVVDDGSDDGTARVIDEHAERLPGLRVITHERPVGLADARNVGLDAATGTYVVFLDGDDWLAPGYLARLVERIDRLGCDFVRVDHVQVQDRERTTHLAPEARRDVVLEPRSGILPATRRTMVDYPYAWAGIYRRDLGALLRFPGGLHTAEDRPWIWRLHREAASYAVSSLAGVFYRRSVANSLTRIVDERQLHFIEAFALVLRQVEGDPQLRPKAVRQFLAVLDHHVAADERFTPALRAELRRRAAAVIATLPADVVADALRDDARVSVLRPMLPPAVLAAVAP